MKIEKTNTALNVEIHTPDKKSAVINYFPRRIDYEKNI